MMHKELKVMRQRSNPIFQRKAETQQFWVPSLPAVSGHLSNTLPVRAITSSVVAPGKINQDSHQFTDKETPKRAGLQGRSTTSSKPLPGVFRAVATPEKPSLLYPNGNPSAQGQKPAQTKQMGVISEDLIQDYRAAYQCTSLEHDYWLEPERVEGSLPAELMGTYMQVAPGILSGAGRPVGHPADADGLVTTISLRGSRVFVRSRFARTPQFDTEKVAGTAVFPRKHTILSGLTDPVAWFNQFLPLAVPIKRSANASLVLWNKEMQVMDQAGSPHRVHPACLDPLAPGALQALVAGHGDLCGRHHVLHGADGSERLILLTKLQLGVNTQVSVFEVAEDGSLLSRTTHVMEECMAAGVQDVAITENYYVIVQSSVMMNLEKYVADYLPGFSPLAACFDFKEDIPAKVHIIPRPGGAAADQGHRIIEAPSQLVLQAVNAFETPQGTIVLDVISRLGTGEPFDLNTLTPDYYVCPELHHPSLRRLTLDVRRGNLAADEILSARAANGVALVPELESWPYRQLYTSAAAVEGGHSWGPSQVLVKLRLPPPTGQREPNGAFWAHTTELWAPGPRCFTQQPLFLPRRDGWTLSTEQGDSSSQRRVVSSEDDGYVVSMVHDVASRSSRLCILDAANFGAGPICTLHLRHALPPANHATFSRTYLGPDRHAPANW